MFSVLHNVVGFVRVETEVRSLIWVGFRRIGTEFGSLSSEVVGIVVVDVDAAKAIGKSNEQGWPREMHAKSRRQLTQNNHYIIIRTVIFGCAHTMR